MAVSILKFAETAIGVIVFAILGVAGQIDSVDVVGGYYVARTTSVQFNVALPPVAYVSTAFGNCRYYKHTARHEIGHLRQAEILHGLFYALVGAPGILWRVSGAWQSHDEYRQFPTEAWADYLSGVNDE